MFFHMNDESNFTVVGNWPASEHWGASRVSQMGLTCGGGKFGQNGQKLYENYKINILGAKQWGDKPYFCVVGGSPPVPPLGETQAS